MKSTVSALISAILLAGCWIGVDFSTKARHESFKTYYDGQVGKSADDPSTNIARYPQNIMSRRVLPNGNTEIKYRAPYRTCRVFYEIDNESRIIVDWRYVGREQDCVRVP